MTTIKVSREVRDTLKDQAKRQGRTLGEHLELLAVDEARRLRFAELKAAMGANPPDDQYRREAAEWQAETWT